MIIIVLGAATNHFLLPSINLLILFFQLIVKLYQIRKQLKIAITTVILTKFTDTYDLEKQQIVALKKLRNDWK